MKKNTVLIAISAVLALSLTGCDDKDTEIAKAIKDSKEVSQKTSGKDQKLPRLNVEFERNKPKKEGEK